MPKCIARPSLLIVVASILLVSCALGGPNQPTGTAPTATPADAALDSLLIEITPPKGTDMVFRGTDMHTMLEAIGMRLQSLNIYRPQRGFIGASVLSHPLIGNTRDVDFLLGLSGYASALSDFSELGYWGVSVELATNQYVSNPITPSPLDVVASVANQEVYVITTEQDDNILNYSCWETHDSGPAMPIGSSDPQAGTQYVVGTGQYLAILVRGLVNLPAGPSVIDLRSVFPGLTYGNAIPGNMTADCADAGLSGDYRVFPYTFSGFVAAYPSSPPSLDGAVVDATGTRVKRIEVKLSLAATPTTNEPPAPTPATPTAAAAICPASATAPLADYTQAVLRDQPSVYYHLDDASGPVAHDASGRGYDGIYQGNAYRLCQPGIFGATGDAAVQIAGDAGYVSTMYQATPLPALTGNHDRTVELWFETSQPGKGVMFITGALSPTHFFQIEIYGAAGPGGCGEPAAPGLQVGFYDDNLDISGASLADGRWHYLAVTVSDGGSTVDLVLDGHQPAAYLFDGRCATATALPQPLSLPRPIDTTPGVVDLGASYNPGNGGFSGTLDEVAIYPNALSAGELTSHYRLGAASGG